MGLNSFFISLIDFPRAMTIAGMGVILSRFVAMIGNFNKINWQPFPR